MSILLAVAMIAALPPCGTAPLRAASPLALALPTGTKPPKCGLRLTVEATWVRGNGYRPVRIAISRTGPAVADREILIELTTRATFSGPRQHVSRYIALPEGRGQVTETLLVPQGHRGWSVQVDVWEEGRKLEELCSKGFSTSGRGQVWSESPPKILVLDSDAPPRAQRPAVLAAPQGRGQRPTRHALPEIWCLATVLPNQFNANPRATFSDRDILAQVSGLDDFELIPPSDAPQSWLGYTCLDLVFVSQEDLASMVANQPARWQALRSWTLAGGTLCVDGVGDRYQRLQALEALCGMSAISDDATSRRGWTVPNPRGFGGEVPSFSMMRQMQGGTVVRDRPDSLAPAASATSASTPGGQPLFVYRPFGFGTAVTIAQEAFPGTRPRWEFLLNTLKPRRWMWCQRHGLSMRQPNDEYWEFLVPGVGIAPVGTFRVLITLFIVGIGPVNYFLLRRWRRLHWLLITVPVGATLVAAGLFGYALVADGLGARVRIRSLTHIDQRQGQAVGWSRQSYYAGLAPSRGLSFPVDTAVYPLVPLPASDHRRSGWSTQSLHWDRQQRLQRGYIGSRVTAQFVTARCWTTGAGLRVTRASGVNEAPVAENRLGAEIQQLYLRDRRGKYFRAEAIPAGAKRPLLPVTAEAVRLRLTEALAANRPVLPEGFAPEDYHSAVSFMGSYRFFGNRAIPPPTMATSVLEQNLRTLPALARTRGRLTARSYVAIVRRGPGVPVGISRAKEVASFHVVTGRW